MSKNKKERIGVVYSTNPDFAYTYEPTPVQETLPVDRQKLRVQLDQSGRKGKVMTAITGFVGTVEDLEELARQLKTKCGTGGSAKDQVVLIQGDVRDKVTEYLQAAGYQVKKG